ncbi:MAG: M28 family peptidase [Flavisolibacter sp.]
MKYLLSLLSIGVSIYSYSQNIDQAINAKEVARIESTLAADEMRGRKTGTPDIDKAADFIATEFKKAGLEPFNNYSFLQTFYLSRPKLIDQNGLIDGNELTTKEIIAITSKPDLSLTEDSGYEVHHINKGENLYQNVLTLIGQKKNQLVFVDTSFARMFPRLNGFKQMTFSSPTSVVFILGNYNPKNYSIKVKNDVQEVKLSNVVGILPGKSKKNEYVIFSGHYDHLGVGRPVNGDSIYNGANDDAAGTTAVILLANYFRKLNNNERTIVFAAFTAEEIGGFGSQYFSRQFDPQQVMAMFNIEMIGTESKWGKNSAYITGFEKTNMGTILQHNLEGSSFSFYPDPYTQENLFYRSDNATLARLGVPAHTISTSKMDDEPNYHKPSDEISTLDIENMTEIIKSIAISSRSIISGKDTPDRVKTEELK